MRDFDDNISYIRVRDKPDDHGVSMFHEKDCAFSRSTIFVPGYYDVDQINYTPLGDDALKALIVPDRVTVQLFEDPQYQGNSVTIVGPVNTCNQPLPGGFEDDTMSSVKIFYD